MYLHIFLQDVENLLKLKKVTFLAFYKKFYDKHLILSRLSTLIYSISTKQKTYIFCTISLVISLSINSLFLKNEGIFCRKKIYIKIYYFSFQNNAGQLNGCLGIWQGGHQGCSTVAAAKPFFQLLFHKLKMSRNVSKMSSKCLQNVSKMSPECLVNGSKMS